MDQFLFKKILTCSIVAISKSKGNSSSKNSKQPLKNNEKATDSKDEKNVSKNKYKGQIGLSQGLPNNVKKQVKKL
jgi:hypothetical protein